MMSYPKVELFYAEANEGCDEHPAFQPFIGLEDDKLVLDGRFTLAHLESIVTAWKNYQKTMESKAQCP